MQEIKGNDFVQIIDSLVELSELDAELKAGLKWIDEESKKRGISFYEMIKIVLETKTMDERAKDWNENRKSLLTK